MATQEGKGSILFKLIIVILAVILILVINIPGRIWSKEQVVMMKSWSNMASIHAAHMNYYKIYNRFADSNTEVIQTIKNDTLLNKRVKIVEYTQKLKGLVDGFLNEDIISNLLTVSLNIQNIIDDLELNEMYFQNYPDILSEAEEIKLRMVKFHSGNENENFQQLITGLDSLWQLRRNLPDYTLQNAARQANFLAMKINKNIPDISLNLLSNDWRSISSAIRRFLKNVNSTNLINVTSVANRVKDFQNRVEDSFNKLKELDVRKNRQNVKTMAEKIGTTYNEFLADFLITEKLAQFSLSETDSILVNVDENMFYTPNGKKSYTVVFQDTLGLTIEDPTLFKELKNRCSVVANKIMKMNILPAFSNYLEKIQSVRQYAVKLKDNYKRNLDIRMKIVELDSSISKLKRTMAMNSYYDLESFIKIVPDARLYSEIADQIEPALAGVGTFNQIYTENVYGDLDTVHIEIIGHLEEFNNILSQIRNNRDSFDSLIEELNTALSQIKKITPGSVIPTLEDCEEQLQNIFSLVSNGITKSVYGVFRERIINLGKVDGKAGRKSWEDPGSIQYKYYKDVSQRFKNLRN